VNDGYEPTRGRNIDTQRRENIRSHTVRAPFTWSPCSHLTVNKILYRFLVYGLRNEALSGSHCLTCHAFHACSRRALVLSFPCKLTLIV
jgi:hypothetical protein